MDYNVGETELLWKKGRCKLNIATIGSGKIVEEMLQAIESLQDVQCVAAFSRTKDKAQRLADRYDIAKIYTNLEEMLSDSEIDTIYIASPNSLHAEQARLSMEYGKNVICEKPFTSSHEEAKALFSLAKEKEVFLFEAIPTLHLPNYQLIKEHLDSLGPIKLVQCNYSQYSSRYDQLKNGEVTNIFDPKFAGGALADINIYNLHFVLNLFGKPEKVNYSANQHSNGIDTSGIAVLSYPTFQASCVGAKDTTGVNFVMIQGEEGYLYVSQGANGVQKVTLKKKDEEIVISVQQDDPRLTYEFRRFQEIITNEDYVSRDQLLEHSLHVASVMEAARNQIGLD